MYDMILEEVVSLGVERLISDLKAAVLEALGRRGPERCPGCGSDRVVRRGLTAGGSRRWACRGCGRSFMGATGGVLALSKLDAGTWASYVEGMAAGGSLRAPAGRCGVCLRTGWFMRMRVLEVMRSRLHPMRHGEGVSAQADEPYLNESLSGGRDRARDAMPREARRNGHGVSARGISSLKVSVVTVVNDLGDCTAALAGRGRPSVEEIGAGLAPADVSDSEVSTDSLASYAAPLAEAGAAAHNRYGSGRPARTSLAWSTPCTSGCGGSRGASAAWRPAACSATSGGSAGRSRPGAPTRPAGGCCAPTSPMVATRRGGAPSRPSPSPSGATWEARAV